MSLKTTLDNLRKEEADRLGFDPKMAIAEWKDAVVLLISDIATMLESYVKDGYIKLKYGEVQINEVDLGEYSAHRMVVEVGNRTVYVSPVGRFVAGAIGRVDMVRDGRRSQLDRVLILRTADKESPWLIEEKPKARLGSASLSPFLHSPQLVRDFTNLNRESLEQGLSYLLELN